MKKVLFTATVDSHILQFHIPYLKMFKEKGYEVHVATNGTEEIPYCDVKHVISFERSPIKINNLKAIKDLKKIIDKEKFDIIHCHTPMGSVVTRIAAKKARKRGTRVIYTAHGFHFFKRAPLINWIIFYPIEKYLSKYTDCLITINHEDYELAKRKFKAKQIELVHGVGVDESKFNFEMTKEEKHELRKSLGLKDDELVLIQVGELNKNKNQIMAIKAMKDLIKENDNIHLLLVGQGELEEFYKQKIEEYNLQKNIHMLGYRNDIPYLMKISDILLSLSYREGLPVNVIEGMMSGLTIIATDCRGNRDLIIDNKKSCLIKNGDINALINSIKLVIKEDVKEKKDINRYLKTEIEKKVKEIYNSVIKIKILHLLSTSEFSGAENVVCQIINMFSNEKEFEMVYCSPDGKIRRELEQKKVKYIPIKNMKYNEIKNVVKKYKPDIIHAHDIRASIFAALFSRYAKIISHIHGNHDNMKVLSLKSILYYIFSKKMTRIFWVSKSAMNEYVLKNKLKEKSKVLINVINKEEIYLRAEKDNNEYQYDVIYLGRLSKEKDPLRVYEIMKDLVKKNRNIKCVMVGDGILKDDLKENIEKDQMKDNILLKGKMENPMKILKSSKVMLMASIYEGTPMCALEAIAFGVPIVSTPSDGLVDIITNNYNGFLSHKNEELIENIQNIIFDNTYREDLSKNALEKFNEINNINEYKRNLMNEYIKKV